MTTLDFPVAPLVGDRFPTPSVAGMPQYIWDGEKWTTATNTITTAPPSTSLPLEDNATASIGVTTKYAREDHVHPSTALKYSAQTLTTAQQVQSRKNLYAAPFDALGWSGLQVNGSYEVSQELGVSGRSSNGYICDGWILISSGMTGLGAAADAVVPIAGFPNRLYIAATAKPSLAAGDYLAVSQPIEGYRIARLGWGTANAQPITIGFWSQHTVAGTYSISISNSGATRTYTTTYQQNVVSIPEYKTVTIPGDTAGTWLVTNGAGLSINFALACGSTYTAPAANTWGSTNYIAAPGQINGVASAGGILVLRGVVVLPGIEAPSAERSPLIMRPYDQELESCKRYWRRTKIGFGTGISATQVRMYIPYPTMRAGPTASSATGVSLTDNYATNPAQGAFGVTAFGVTNELGIFDYSNFAGIVAGRFYTFLANGTDVLLDARL